MLAENLLFLKRPSPFKRPDSPYIVIMPNDIRFFKIAYNRSLQQVSLDQSHLMWNQYGFHDNMSIIGGTMPQFNTGDAHHALMEVPRSTIELEGSLSCIPKGESFSAATDLFGRIDIHHLSTRRGHTGVSVHQEVANGRITGIRITRGEDTEHAVFVPMEADKPVIIGGLTRKQAFFPEGQAVTVEQATRVYRTRSGRKRLMFTEATNVAVAGLGATEMVLKLTPEGTLAFEKVGKGSIINFLSSRAVDRAEKERNDPEVGIMPDSDTSVLAA